MTDEKRKIAIEQYRIVIGYLQYENTVFWSRVWFIVSIEMALIVSMVSAILPRKNGELLFYVSLFLFIFVGLFLCVLGLRMIVSGRKWIDRWVSILIKIENDVFCDIEVFRGASSANYKVISLRSSANYPIYLLMMMWFMIVVYVVFPFLC